MLARQYHCKAFFVDSPETDELQPLARITGMKGVYKVSSTHTLNQKAVCRFYAEQIGMKYEDLNLICSHIGGGVSVSAHRRGEIIDSTNLIKGDGPMGTLVAVADHGKIRACADDPKVELPLREDGKLDVGSAVGHHGRLIVIKDLNLKENYIGQSELVSGEIAMDFAQYFTVSEQQPSLVALGVLVSGETVLKAGGLLIQPLPGCPDEIIDQLELRSPMFADISREMTFAPIEQLCEDWFRGMNPKILERTPVSYTCSCSRERMERALISLGRKELTALIEEDQGAELVCHFCHNKYFFTTEQLCELLKEAQRE